MTGVIRYLGLIAALHVGLVIPLSSWAHAQPTRYIEPTLAFESRTPAAGDTVSIAISMVPEAGWHGYWSNPGEVGLPVEARWQAAPGVTFGELQHPAPSLLDVQGITSYVHKGRFTLLATMRVPEGLAPGTALPVRVALNWLVCSDTLCVPESATLSANLKIGDGAADRTGSLLVNTAKRALPRALSSASLSLEAGNWVYSLPASVGTGLRIFPASEGWFDAGAPQSVSREGDRVTVRVPASPEAPLEDFRGVVTAGGQAYAITANAEGVMPTMQAVATSPDTPAVQAQLASAGSSNAELSSPASEAGDTSIVLPDAGSADVLRIALTGALVGGLLLNLMPCVFPILSLKAMSLAKSGGDPSAARREGLGYAAGTIFTALFLGGLLIGLRALGMEIGWSFQLQSPGVILVLLVLTSAIALNLAGLFEIPMPSFAGRASSRSGWFGGFSTGSLAAVIGMPCSGPFMAGALGAALVLPAPLAVGVFAMLGLGMALPFLAIAYVPAIQRRLPRPGAWMATLRRVLSLPMFATALALAWLLGRQTGVDGMAIGLVTTLTFAASLWWLGLRQSSGTSSWQALAPGVIGLVATLAIGLPATESPAREQIASMSEAREPFSEARLAELRAAGTPVFVDFTADWCLICQVNERVAIDTQSTRMAFDKAGVVTLVGDWTRQDVAITRFLEKHGRNSIPFYLFYPTNGEPEILPQVLTPQILSGIAEGQQV